MKIVLLILKSLAFLVLAFVIGVAAYVQSQWPMEHEGVFPDIKASTDSAVISHGEYLAYGPAHCADCHIPVDHLTRLEKGEKVPLIGGHVFKLPFGNVVTPNITPDPERGIGKISDAEIARALRYNVGHEGQGLIGFMAFQHMSDADLTAVISYLRSTAAVKSDFPKTEWSFAGRALWVLGVIWPEGPVEEIPNDVTPDTTATYGRYLAEGISNCKGCHTDRDMKTGKFTSPYFSGGFHMPSELHEGRTYVTPNITPDPQTGWISEWSEQQFIERFHKGRVYEDSPMPWTSFKNFSDNDLKALYRYLVTLDPVNHEVKQSVLETR